jgi:hypothetical protein
VQLVVVSPGSDSNHYCCFPLLLFLLFPDLSGYTRVLHEAKKGGRLLAQQWKFFDEKALQRSGLLKGILDLLPKSLSMSEKQGIIGACRTVMQYEVTQSRSKRSNEMFEVVKGTSAEPYSFLRASNRLTFYFPSCCRTNQQW